MDLEFFLLKNYYRVSYCAHTLTDIKLSRLATLVYGDSELYVRDGELPLCTTYSIIYTDHMFSLSFLLLALLARIGK
jgi:hypothetical protein